MGLRFIKTTLEGENLTDSQNNEATSKVIGFSTPLNPGEHTAKMLIEAYRHHPNHIKFDVDCKSNGSLNSRRLDGLRVTGASLQHLLGITTTLPDIMICFAMSHKDVDATTGDRTSDKQNFTTVLVKIDQYNNIDPGTAVNFCDPCPTACPSNMASLISELHQNCPK